MNEEINKQALSYEELQKALALYIWKNENLRDEIIKDPKAFIARDLNVNFDDNTEVKVINCTDPNEVVFILPYNVNKHTSAELSDDELEGVAGGKGNAAFAVLDALGKAVMFPLGVPGQKR